MGAAITRVEELEFWRGKKKYLWSLFSCRALAVQLLRREAETERERAREIVWKSVGRSGSEAQEVRSGSEAKSQMK